MNNFKKWISPYRAGHVFSLFVQDAFNHGYCWKSSKEKGTDDAIRRRASNQKLGEGSEDVFYEFGEVLEESA